MSRGTLEQRLARARRRIIGRLRRQALARLAIAVLATVWVAWLAAGAGGWRPGSPVPLVLDAVLGIVVVVTLFRLSRSARRWAGDDEIGSGLERDAGLPDGTVRSALELRRTPPPGVSPALVERGASSVEAAVRGVADEVPSSIESELRGVGTWLRRTFAAGLLVTLLLGALSPTRMWTAWGGLAAPAGVLARDALPALGVRPGDAEIARGERFELSVDAQGRTSVDVVWQSTGDIERRETVPVLEGRALWQVDPVTLAFNYRVEAVDGARSETFSVTPVDPLFVGEVSLALTFPDYLDRPSEELRGDVPTLQLPAGTRIDVRGQASAAVTRAALATLDGREVELQAEGLRFFGGWVPARSGLWSWSIDDARGQAARALPSALDIVVQPDLAPEVRVLQPPRDTLLALDMRQPLVIEATDDWGVAWLELVVRRVPAVGVPGAPVSQRIEAGGLPGVLVRPVLDLSDWGLVPGDQIEYWVRVADTHPQPREGRSETGILRVPEVAELRRETGRELDEAAQALEALREAADEAAQQAREAGRAAAAERPERADSQGRADAEAGESPAPDGEFERREQLRQSVAEAAERGAQVDSLRQLLEQVNRAVTEAGAASSGLRSDLDEVAELLDELGSQSGNDELQALLEGMDQIDPAQAAAALEELARDQQRLEQQLEEAVARLERAAARQAFESTTRDARDLAMRQQALADALAEDSSESRAEQQAELASEVEAAEERMGELSRRLDSMGEREAGAQVQQARAETEQARAEMSRAAARAQQGQNAAAPAQQAAQQLQQAADALEQAQQRMSEERARAFHEAVQRVLRDALALARTQGAVSDRLEDADARTRAALRTEVAAQLQGTEQSALHLARAARDARAEGAERPILIAMGEAMEMLDRTLQALDRPSAPGLPSPLLASTQSQIELNRTAHRALEVADQLTQGSSAPQPSAEQAMEQLQELAQEQADLNNEASQLMPMELTPQAMQQQMQRMAQRQQEVAQQVGDMAEQQGDGPLGDLEALAEEAEALASALEQGRLDATTRERQERLFHRLLDAGRSLEREGETTERESESAGVVEPELVEALDAEALQLLRYRLNPSELEELPPGVRALVRSYLRRLNEGGAAAVIGGTAPSDAGAPPAQGAGGRR